MDTKFSKLTAADKGIMVFAYVILGLFMVAIIFPVIYIILASFIDPITLQNHGLTFDFSKWTLTAYERVMTNDQIWIGFKNAMIYSVLFTIISVAVTLLAAYPMSRPDFKGKGLLNTLFVITMFFGGGLIPTYLLISSLGLLNNPLVLILPGCFGIYNMIIARTFFQSSIPGELRDAAFIDGCGECGFFVRIALPLSKAIISVIGLYVAVAIWNDYFSALIYITDREYIPLQLVLREILISNSFDTRSAGGGITNSALEQQRLRDLVKYCVMVVSTLPVICIYPFIQKYFEKGVMIGSIKG